LIDNLGFRQEFRSTNDKIIASGGGEFHFRGLQDINNILSLASFDILWIEEAATLSADRWIKITPTIRKAGSEIWATWNPQTEYDPVFERFCKPFYKDNEARFLRAVKSSEDTFYIHTTFEDNPYFPEVLELERLKCLKDSPEDYDWVWQGKPFSKDGFKTFITGEQVRASQGNKKRWADVEYAAKIIGVDPARFGDDEALIVLRQGLKCEELKAIKGLDNMQLAGFVAEAIRRHNPDAVFIDAGRGEGVIDRLRQLNFEVIEVNFGGEAFDKVRYFNKRAEMYGAVRNWIKNGGNLPEGMDWYRECSATQYSPTSGDDNRIRLERKEKVKERIGKSPGRMDALALTFALPISKADEFERQTARSKAEQFDVLSRDEDADILAGEYER
jgi:phage terminase large subunit